MDDLISDQDLQSFPGAPFPSDVVLSVSEAIRKEAGWHIAPEVERTITIQTHGSPLIVLPSLRVTEVHSVKDALSGADLDGHVILSETGNVLFPRRKRLPRVITIRFSHGYEKCPADLLLFAASRSQMAMSGMVRQESIGSRSLSLGSSLGVETSSVVLRYKLPQGV